jgi:IS1 family transposase/transposase-like protein
MVSHLFYYQLALLALIWLFVMLPLSWPRRSETPPPVPAPPLKPKRKRSTEPKAFAGLTHKPPCALCERETGETPPALPPRPDPMPLTTRRPRTVDTSRHFCPHTACNYRGWLGLNNLRANGHPNGGPWRQFHCTACEGYFPEHHGTIFHGKQASVELIVRVLACLAEGLGIRATARVFEVDPTTVLHWLVEAAEQLRAFSAYFFCDLHLEQLQLDEVYAVLRDRKAGEINDDEAIARLERTPSWVWTALDPTSKLLVVVDIGSRTLAMAQRVVHQVVQGLAPGCVPLFLTDGFKAYTTALLTHFGQWVQPARRQTAGPMPKPRWMPLPQLLYAQVIKAYRRRRLVDVTHRVVFGTGQAIAQVLARWGWSINTAFVERLNLDIRQRVAAIGRRVNTLCQGEAGLRDQVKLFQVYHNFVLPHASLRQGLAEPMPTNGRGSVKMWRPCTPAMAAGLTDHVWSLKEVLCYRVPPWPQTQTV